MKEYVDKSMSFSGYNTLIDRLLDGGKTTGTNQSAAMVGYGRLNHQRMVRLAKTLVLNDEVRAVVAENTRRQIWLILTEGWCGDAAQNVPAIEKVADVSDLIETRYILRDENLELMDRYLTDGARSIPKLIALDAGTLEVIFTWGPRPAEAQAMFKRRRDEGFAHSIITEELQRWYNADHGHSVQRELAELVASSQVAKTATTT